MTEGLIGVQARIDQLRALVGGGPQGRAAPLGTAWSSSTTGAPAGTAGSGDFAAKIAALLSGGAGATTGAMTGAMTGAAPGTAPGAGSDARSGAAGGALGAAAVGLARTFEGVPYLWGGTDPKKGLDCSGLVQLVYRRLGVTLPRTSQEQQRAGTEVPLSAAQPGDLVFFGEPAHHVGIYVGDGMMIDAPRTGSTVGVHKIAGYGKVSHVRRLGTPGGATASGALATAGTLGALGPTAPGVSGPYADLFTAAGTRYGVEPALLSAVAKAESGYRPRAVSGAGALGLMQLMPGTARSLGVDPLQPDQAVDGAARLLSGHLRTYSGRVDLALAAYNAGPGAVNRYGGVPPYAETQTYVQRVTSYWKALR